MTFNPHTATVIEMRDWLANRERNHKIGGWWHDSFGQPITNHPIPATLDWVAKAMPDGCWWSKYETTSGGEKWAVGRHGGLVSITLTSTGDEYTDRLRLFCLVLMAEDASKGKEPSDGE